MCSTDFGSLNVENTSISVGQANYNTWDKKYNLTENYWTHCGKYLAMIVFNFSSMEIISKI